MSDDMSEEEILQVLEVDLDVAECIDILERYRVDWTPDLAVALWDWKQSGSDA